MDEIGLRVQVLRKEEQFQGHPPPSIHSVFPTERLRASRERRRLLLIRLPWAIQGPCQHGARDSPLCCHIYSNSGAAVSSPVRGQGTRSRPRCPQPHLLPPETPRKIRNSPLGLRNGSASRFPLALALTVPSIFPLTSGWNTSWQWREIALSGSRACSLQEGRSRPR